MLETHTAIETIFYLLKKIGPADKIKIIKLVYLADKYHLLRYGRTVTGDDYYAMEHGPVGSTIKDVLSFNDLCLNEDERSYLETLIERGGSVDWFTPKDGAVCHFEMLSETDKEALDFVIDTFAAIGHWDLRDYTHQYPEWKQHEDLLKNRRAKRILIKTEELLSLLPNDKIAVPKEHVEDSKKILLGNYD
jgi:uncharacterized phage-associated protein